MNLDRHRVGQVARRITVPHRILPQRLLLPLLHCFQHHRSVARNCSNPCTISTLICICNKRLGFLHRKHRPRTPCKTRLRNDVGSSQERAQSHLVHRTAMLKWLLLMLVNICSHQHLNPENTCFLFRLRLIFLVYIYVIEKEKRYKNTHTHTSFGCLWLFLDVILFSWLTLLGLCLFSFLFGKFLVLLSGWFFLFDHLLSLSLLHILELFSQMCRPNYFLCVLDVYVDISCCVLRGFIHICTLSFLFSSTSFCLVFSLFISLYLFVFCAEWSAETFSFRQPTKRFNNKDKTC